MSLLDAERAAELLARARGVRALVVGDLMLDRYVSGRVERVSPEAPVPVVRVEAERVAPGGAGNVAANVTALGAACSVVGCTGEDEEAEQLMAGLERCGVDASGVTSVASRPTTSKTRVHTRRQQIVRLDREEDAEVDADTLDALMRAVTERIDSADAVVIQDYDKGVLTPGLITGVLALARQRDVPVVVDPKRRSFFRYEGATVFKPNRRELEDALGAVASTDDRSWMEDMRVRLGCAHLLVTLGEHGMALQTRGGELVRLATAAQAVYDVSGAGDTVSAVVAVVMAAGGSAVEAAVLASHAAALEVSRPGVQTVTPAEIRAHVEAWAHRPFTAGAAGTAGGEGSDE